jgi:hypothetical protein
MTINIEREAIIRVLDTAGSSFPCHPQRPLKPPSPGGLTRGVPGSPARYVGGVCKHTDDAYCPDLLSLDSDEDCISLSSCDSASSYGGTSTTTERSRVSFSYPLVTEVKLRPRTKDSEKKTLFYTQSETDR